MTEQTDLRRQFGIYLVVGAWNTVFGMAVYCGCVWMCEVFGRFGYLVAGVLSMVFGVTHSYVTYKLIVFRTRGNWFSEYVKCWSVYGGASLVNFLLLPVSVEAVRLILSVQFERYAPYAGGLMLTGITVLLSFFGHRHFTFKGGNHQ